ncbi:MAG: FtsX-like permease family protein [Planctomycetia bacterium]
MTGSASGSLAPTARRDRQPVTSLVGLIAALSGAWWPRLGAVAAAAAVVAAAIAGSLGVGDAMQRGLRALAVARLGAIDAAIVADEPFGPGMAESLRAAGLGGLVPALVLDVAVEHESGGRRRSARATLLACDDPAGLGFVPPPPPLAEAGVFVNAPLARAVGADGGDSVILRVPRPSAEPADSPLGRRTAESNGRRLAVTAVLPDAGLGRFSLRPTQVTGPLVVTSLGVARDLLGRDGATNAVFAVGAGREPGADALRRRIRPSLADYGLSLEPAGRAGCPRLTSRRLLLPAAVDRAAATVLAPLGGRPSLVFLVNAIEPAPPAGEPPAGRPASIPYSTVAGIDATSLPVGALVDGAGRPLPLPAADEIVIDRWMADDLAAQGRPVVIGDAVDLRFFAAETLHGRVVENSTRLRIAGIASMAGAAVAREFVPEVEGVTDEKSIADWDPPFPFDANRVRTTPPHDEDDRYWKEHGAAPKAFVSLETARRLAGSRFGATTAWHLPPLPAHELAAVRDRLAAAIAPESLGIRVVPLRAEAIAAARGSTPFGGLFLALSSFVVGAGLILEWLLFRLLVAARRRDIGILSAIGWPPRRLVLLLGGIAAGAAATGALAGTLLGPAWTRLLLAGLSRGWQADVAAGSAAVFQGHAPTPAAVWPGGVIAFFMSLLAVVWGARRIAAAAPLQLLGAGTETLGGGRGGACWSAASGAAAAVAAAAVALLGRRAEGQAAVGWFFGAGGLGLVAALAFVRAWLHGGPRGGPLRSLPGLVGRGLAHAPARAFAVAAIVAVAEFLVVAVSSVALRPPADPRDRGSPTGGWSFVVGFGTPTAVDPQAAEVRGALGMTEAEERAVADCTLVRLRRRDGDAADCTSLYAAARPPVIGVGPDFVARGGFSFADRGRAAARATAEGTATINPWTLLASAAADAAGPVPAILDQATAQWALKYGGVGGRFTLPDDAGLPVEFEIVALLEPGILQGVVLVADREFTRIFPGRSGYGMALVDEGMLSEAARAAARSGLATAWADAAPEFTGAGERLRSLQGVQNTFLAAFQALGTLGLLLGTAGVAAVQVQNAIERAGALALLRALGFTLAQVRLVLVGETLVAVAVGLAAGTAAACLAVWPALAAGTAAVPLSWIAISAGLAILAAGVAALASVRRTTIPERPTSA